MPIIGNGFSLLLAAFTIPIIISTKHKIPNKEAITTPKKLITGIKTKIADKISTAIEPIISNMNKTIP